ncbi:MAG: ArsR family transcriptional regulator [Candidatus Methanomethylicota archaeon]|nr:MAG: ArsR family transcriptional regulator [Candidatus Verstraetearchaeota archaeon]
MDNNSLKGREMTSEIREEQGVLIVRGKNVVKIASALSSETRIKILEFLKGKEVDIGQVAELINQSKANASAQMRILEKYGLVKTTYKPGKRGVKKVCTSNIREVRLILE